MLFIDSLKVTEEVIYAILWLQYIHLTTSCVHLHNIKKCFPKIIFEQTCKQYYQTC